MTEKNKETKRSFLRPFNKKVEYWLTIAVCVAAIVFSILLVKSSEESTKSQMKSMERNHAMLAQSHKNYNESHSADRKRWLDDLHEVKMKVLALESDVHRLNKAMLSNELASKRESMSNQDWQAMVLENANPKDRKILESHFKQENKFKASLSRTQKNQFDDKVRKTYVKMLADSGGEDALSGLQKQAIRRIAETMTMAEWQSRETANRALANAADYVAQRDERLRLFRETLSEETEAGDE